MTTYPLEYFLSTVGTPHIKIVDWSAGHYGCLTIDEARRIFMDQLRRGQRSWPKDIVRSEYRLSNSNSDYHLLLTLEYGKVEDFQITEEEAISLINEAKEQ